MGQHRRPARRRRWPWLALGAALVVAAGAVAVVQLRQTAAGCDAVPVTVAVDPTALGAVQRALDAGSPGRECARYDLVSAAPSLASEIRAGSPGLPAVWIPQSTLALDPLDEAVDTLVERGASLASSPVVLAVPTADAGRYGDPAQPVAWTTVLTSPSPPALPDPDVEPGGLAALTILRTAIGEDDGRPRPAFVAAVLALAEGAPDSASAGFEAMARDGAAARAFLTSEQAVVQHNASQGGSAQGGDGATNGTAASVTALAFAEGGAALDYPFVRVLPRTPQGDQADRVDRAVDQLEDYLRGPAGQDAFSAVGLRAPDGSRGPDRPDVNRPGMIATEVMPGAVPEPSAAVETLRLWSALTLRSRVLAVIDTSGSMAAKAGDSDRITLAAGAAQGGLALFPDSSSVGLWAFSSGLSGGQAWQELVPIGKLTDPVGQAPSRRAALAAQSATLRDRLGGETALYDTVIAATRAVRAGYEPGASNSVVLITDGRNEIDGGIDLPTTVQTLRAEADPTRPVPVIAIAIGPDTDIEALRQIAEATDGQAYLAENPADIRTVFLDALSQRTCRPGC